MLSWQQVCQTTSNILLKTPYTHLSHLGLQARHGDQTVTHSQQFDPRIARDPASTTIWSQMTSHCLWIRFCSFRDNNQQVEDTIVFTSVCQEILDFRSWNPIRSWFIDVSRENRDSRCEKFWCETYSRIEIVTRWIKTTYLRKHVYKYSMEFNTVLLSRKYNFLMLSRFVEITKHLDNRKKDFRPFLTLFWSVE